MSLLAATTKRTLFAPTQASGVTAANVFSFESRRYASRKRWLAKVDAKKSGVQRDSSGKPIKARKEKTPPLFTPLSADQLKSIAQIEPTTTQKTLKLMSFTPKTVERGNVAEAMEFQVSAHDPIRHFGLPKKVWKEFKLLGKSVSVVRDVTVDTIETLAKAGEKPSNETRLVLSGKSGCGKSYLLLQGVEWCIANGWVVMYIPRAVNLVNSTTSYAYDARTQTFLQPDASYQILHRAKEVNGKILKEMKLRDALVADGVKTVPAGTSLYDLLNIPREEVGRAPLVLETLMKELEQQTTHPVLLAIDDFQALFARTAYRDPHFKPIASYHLQAPRLLLSYASGKRAFAKGAVVGALDASDPAYPISLELNEALDLPMLKPVAPRPYEKRSNTLETYAQGLVKVDVPEKLSVREAGSVFEVWMKQRALGSKAYDELFMSKYVESGGNARDFVWKGLLGTLQV